MKVVMIYGSANEQAFMQIGKDYLTEQNVPWEERVLSAHRNLPELLEYLESLNQSGEKVIILAIAGLAAALPGVVAASTELPCVGVPVPGGPLNGIDALLSISQLPGGVPVRRPAQQSFWKKNNIRPIQSIMPTNHLPILKIQLHLATPEPKVLPKTQKFAPSSPRSHHNAVQFQRSGYDHKSSLDTQPICSLGLGGVRLILLEPALWSQLLSSSQLLLS